MNVFVVISAQVPLESRHDFVIHGVFTSDRDALSELSKFTCAQLTKLPDDESIYFDNTDEHGVTCYFVAWVERVEMKDKVIV